MEQSVNQFTGGLQCDVNPMMLGKDVLSDALNASIITMQGNEPILQNDMGNRRINEAFLPSGYEPVGIKEYGGIIYVAAYNPVTNRSQIGSFPSPQRKIDISSEFGKSIDLDSIFDDTYKVDYLHNLECIKYDSKLIPLTNDTSLHTGDKFVVYSTNLNLLENSISNYNNVINGKVISPKNRKYTLALGVLNSQNEFVDITKSLCRWRLEIDKQRPVVKMISYENNESELYQFNDGYFIAPAEYNPGSYEAENDKELILKRQTHPANTYSYKLAGPLYLKQTLNHIQEFTYNIYGTKNENNADLVIEAFITYNCPDGIIEKGVGDDTYDGYYDNQQPMFNVFNLIEYIKNDEEEILTVLDKSNRTEGKAELISTSLLGIDINLSGNIKLNKIVKTKGKIRYINAFSEDEIYEDPKIKVTFIENDIATFDLFNDNEEELKEGIKSTLKWIPETLQNTKYNPETNTYSCKIIQRYNNVKPTDGTKFNYVIGVLADKDTPDRYLSELSDVGELDFSLFGTGIIDMKSWRFQNNYNDKTSTILYDLIAYPKYGEKFERGELRLQATKYYTFKKIEIKKIEEDKTYIIQLNKYWESEFKRLLKPEDFELYNYNGDKYIELTEKNYNKVQEENPAYPAFEYLHKYKKIDHKPDPIIIENISLNNGRNILNINWEDYGIESRTMYEASIIYTIESKDGDVKSEIKRWLLTTELFNDCYNITSNKFVQDYGDFTENTVSNENAKSLLKVKFDFTFDNTYTVLDKKVITNGKTISESQNEEPITFTTKQTISLNKSKKLNFNEELYPKYVTTIAAPQISFEYPKEGNVNYTMQYHKNYTDTNLNGKIEEIKDKKGQYEVINKDWLSWSGSSQSKFENKFVKIDNNVISNLTKIDNKKYAMVSLDWWEKSSRDQHYLKTNVGEEKIKRLYKEGDSENSDNLIQHIIKVEKVDHLFTFKLKDYMSEINEVFNGAVNEDNKEYKKLFTWGFYADAPDDSTSDMKESNPVSIKEFNTKDKQHTAGKWARVWWRTPDDTWALFQEPMDIMVDVDNKETGNVNKFFNDHIGEIIFAHYKKDKEEGEYIVPSNLTNYSIEYNETEGFIIVVMATYNEKNVIDIENPLEAVPKFQVSDNSIETEIIFTIPAISSEEFSEMKEQIVSGSFNTISGFYMGDDNNLIFQDSNGFPLNTKCIYKLEGGKLIKQNLNIYVDDDFHPDFRGILYSGKTPGTPKKRYDFGSSSGNGNTSIDYAGINLVQNVKV